MSDLRRGEVAVDSKKNDPDLAFLQILRADSARQPVLTVSPLLLPELDKVTSGKPVTLDEYVSLRERHQNSRSYLSHATGWVTKQFMSEDSSAQFELAQRNGDRQQMQRLMEKDRNQLATEEDVNSYVSGFGKATFLFMNSKKALWGLAAVNFADSARPGDSLGAQVLDAGAAYAKARVLKYSFEKIGEKNWSPVTKGWGLGISGRLTEGLFTRSAYYDPKTGELDIGNSLLRTCYAAINPSALVTDAVLFGTAHLGVAGLNKVTGNAIANNKLYATMSMGGTFGMTAGALEEIEKAHKLGIPVQWENVLKRSLIRGGLDTIAAIPGGRQARAEQLRFQELTMNANATNRTEGELPKFDPDAPGPWREVLTLPRPEGPALAERSKRLEYTTGVEPMFVSKPGQANLSSPEAYVASAATEVNVPVRIYSVEGHNTKIVVPETYARELDAVRQVRLQLEGGKPGQKPATPDVSLLERALPEDVIPMLDAFPGSQNIRRVILRNDANPMDRWHGHQSGNPEFVSVAETNSRQDISFFSRNMDPYMWLEFSHEGGHVLRDLNPAHARLFDHAAVVEGRGHQLRDRASVNPEEHFSVALGENMLNPLHLPFAELAHRAPVRTLTLSRMLRESLSMTPFDKQTDYHRALERRLDYVDAHVRPLAMAKLNATARDATNPQAQESAIRMLVQMREGASLVNAGTLPLLLSSEPLGDIHVKPLAGGQFSTVDLSRTGVTRLDFLSRSEATTSLDASHSKVQSSALWLLPSLRQLTQLKLSGTRIDDSAQRYLQPMSQLRHLDLTGTNMSATAVAALRRSLPSTEIKY